MENINFKIIILISFLLVIFLYFFGRSILHLVYSSVSKKKTSEQVYAEIGPKINQLWDSRFNMIGLKCEPKKICLICLKNEKVLEVWTNDLDDKKLIAKYIFKGFSGTLGPKLRAGDNQIPEGIYKIEYLNPNSRYHLSMKINYPNNFDKENARHDNRVDLGGDIFIHGKNATIGCIPIGDKSIEELYVLVYKIGIENVEVIIAPNDLRIEKSKYKNTDIKWLDEAYKQIQLKIIKYKNSLLSH